jgi:hypothetical protein
VGTAANRNGRCRDRCARAEQESPSRPHRAPPSHEVRKNKVRPVAAGSILRGAARGNEGDPAHASPTEPAARPGGPRKPPSRPHPNALQRGLCRRWGILQIQLPQPATTGG